MTIIAQVSFTNTNTNETATMSNTIINDAGTTLAQYIGARNARLQNTRTATRRPTALVPSYRQTYTIWNLARHIAPAHLNQLFIFATATPARPSEYDAQVRQAIHQHGQDLSRAMRTGADMAHITNIITSDSHWYRLLALLSHTNTHRESIHLDRIVPCSHCGTLYAEDDGFADHQGEPLCESCGTDTDLFVFCENFGLVRRQDAVEIATVFRRDHQWRWIASETVWAHEDSPEARDACVLNFYFHNSQCDRCTLEAAENNGFCQSESTGEWLDEDEFIEQQGYTDDDEESDDDEVYAYHSHPLRRVDSYWAEKSQRHDPALGVELEIYARESVPSALADIGLDWIVEYDGSLNPVHGREIVTPPRQLSYWQDLAPRLCAALTDDADASGYDAPDATERDYGIHITLHRRHLSRLQEHRLILFCSGVENTHFIRAVAQRRDVYDADLSIGGLSLEKSDRSPRRFGYRKECPAQHRNLSTTKRQPVNLKENLLEFRIFHSTLNPQAFTKNLEFVHALVAWTQPAQCTGKSVFYGDFIRWIADRSKDYPALHEFLGRDDYGVKRGTRVPNTWKEYMTK